MTMPESEEMLLFLTISTRLENVEQLLFGQGMRRKNKEDLIITAVEMDGKNVGAGRKK